MSFNAEEPMKNKFTICIYSLFYFHCEDDGNILAEWDEPDYVNNSGRGDQLSNLVLSADRSSI